MPTFREYNPKELELKEKHHLLLSSVAPRPIGFTTSKSKDGIINLAPFSYHNAFSSDPPMVGISPAFSGRTGNAKDTLTNILATKEFTLSVVSFDMVEQMNICAAEFPPEVNEFEKSGLTKHPSIIVSTPGVAESPLIMECQFTEHIQFSDQPAGGNLLLGEIVYFHAKEEVFDESGKINTLNLNTSIIKIFENSIVKIQKRGKVISGDKSILDIYEPVLNFLKSNNNFNQKIIEINNVLSSSLNKTKNMEAKVGRAKFLENKGIGTLDPGAYSTKIILTEYFRAIFS